MKGIWNQDTDCFLFCFFVTLKKVKEETKRFSKNL